MQDIASLIACRTLKPGMRVEHVDYGPAVITKVRRKDGTIFIRLDEGGYEGTTTVRSLRREPVTVRRDLHPFNCCEG